ncbi:MAG: N-acetylneuraminate synthase family protein [Pseudomonadota bacterium]
MIAEVGMNHDGSVGTAHAFIDAIADTGADCVKFQARIATAESTFDEPFRVRMSSQDKTRFDYWRRMEFAQKQWSELMAHARDKGLVFLCSVFSPEAAHMMAQIGMSGFKIGSGEFNFPELLSSVSEHRKPVLLSTGMSKMSEIESQVSLLRDAKCDFGLFQCTSAYPARLEDVGLNVIPKLRERFSCPAGLSDHSGTVYPTLAAMAQGANMIEVHVSFHKRAFGPDVSSSVTIDELSQLCLARDAFFTMSNSLVDKDSMSEKLSPMRSLFRRSLATTSHLKAGSILTADDLRFARPGTGIPAGEKQSLIGRTLARDVDPLRLLQYDDLEGVPK